MPDITGIVALACVVESSLTLASEWRWILSEYVVPVLKRLNDIHPGYQVSRAQVVTGQTNFDAFQTRIGFITYATADARPTPILVKRHFSALLPAVFKELNEEPARLGIGQTSSGTNGMAALEGLIAAVEVFV
jgi:hypothetical protein